MENLNKVIETLERSNSHFETVNKQREDTICKLRDELTECEGDLTSCQSLLCKKMLCKKRLPIAGLGKSFFNDLKDGKVELDYTDYE